MNIAHRLKDLLHIVPRLHVAELVRPIEKKLPTIVLLHGIGNSAASWSELTPHIPKDVNVIAVDLLGFGKSPKPTWAKYDAVQHATALSRTLRHLHIQHDIILIGHSLGAFVAIEYARRYPKRVSRLILCSPPFYQPDVTSRIPRIGSLDEMYRRLYTNLQKNPKYILSAGKILKQYVNLNKGIDITELTLPAYIKSLQSCIVNQKSCTDILEIEKPIDIFYGRLDVLLIKANLTRIAQINSNVRLHGVTAGHEVIGSYQKSLLRHINKLVATYQAQDRPK